MKDHISWNEYFMGVAVLSSKRSKDPNTKVGACVVNADKRIIGIGYNGFPFGCSDDEYPWGKNTNYLNSKYPYVVHAEPNAILNCTSSLKGPTLYVTLFPSNECAKLIMQSGIKRVVYASDKYHDQDSFIASRRMFDSAGICYEKMPAVSIELTTQEEEQ